MIKSQFQDISHLMKCPNCAFAPEFCICSAITPISCQPKITIFRHYKESYRLSNSARLIKLCIEDTDIFDYGFRDRRLPDIDLEGAVLLFPPIEDSAVYSSELPPKRIIIVDGTWRQAHKIRKRTKGLKALPHLAIQSTMDLPKIRKPYFAGGMSTIEACLEALALYNESESIAQLQEYYTLWLNTMCTLTGIRAPLRPGISFKEARIEQDCIDGKDYSTPIPSPK